MENEILAFLNRRENLRADLVLCLTDTSIPLDTRWSAFLSSEDILPIWPWIDRPMDIYSDCLYDDFCIERHQTATYAEIDEQVCQNSTTEGEEPGYQAEFWDACYAKRDLWREAVLASGYSGFVYDW
jgi:hypothetical protein